MCVIVRVEEVRGRGRGPSEDGGRGKRKEAAGRGGFIQFFPQRSKDWGSMQKEHRHPMHLTAVGSEVSFTMSYLCNVTSVASFLRAQNRIWEIIKGNI